MRDDFVVVTDDSDTRRRRKVISLDDWRCPNHPPGSDAPFGCYRFGARDYCAACYTRLAGHKP